MVQVPLLGIRFLARVGLFAAAAVAVPIVIRKCKPLAEKVGDTLIKAGEQLKSKPEAARPSQANKAEAAKAKPPSTPKRRSAAKRRVATPPRPRISE